MSDKLIYSVAENWSADCWIDADKYKDMYRQSLEEPDIFWTEQSDLFLSWEKAWDTLSVSDFQTAKASWFIGGKLNIAVNCIDRHLEKSAKVKT